MITFDIIWYVDYDFVVRFKLPTDFRNNIYDKQMRSPSIVKTEAKPTIECRNKINTYVPYIPVFASSRKTKIDVAAAILVTRAPGDPDTNFDLWSWKICLMGFVSRYVEPRYRITTFSLLDKIFASDLSPGANLSK